jgi:L-lactate dehydrogenase complex protein LldF
MHKSIQEIAQLFRERLGVPVTDNAEQLAMIARDHLRKTYVTSDIGVTGANFIIAEEGTLVLTENEGNARLTMSCPAVHVVIVGIEKVLPRLRDLSLFLPLLATSGTGQQITGYNSIIRGPKIPSESDGPGYLYVILLDNGRSELYTRTEFRSALRCIRCGACLNACPVYRTIGGHTYHTTYQGPIGSVITPHLKGLGQWNHLSFASSLCAACSSVCPVDIDIHKLLLENRWQSFQSDKTGYFWNIGLRIWAWMMSHRSRLDLALWFGRPFIKPLKLLMNKNLKRRIPDLPKRTFAKMWEENEQQR